MTSAPPQASDEELMLAYAGGDQRAFKELFQRLAPLLLRVLQRQLGQAADAQDLTQQTFLQLHRARRDYRRGLRVKPWVMTIAMNLARDAFRRRGRWRETDIDGLALADPSLPPSVAESEELAGRVRAALAQLPREQRQVIELHWFEELSFVEIAGVVAASAGAVRVRAHRGYVKLRELLGPDGARLPREQGDEGARS